MQITVNIEEKSILRYGTLVITNISPDPQENLEVSVPGFKYIADKENPPFVINRAYGDVRDTLYKKETDNGKEARKKNKQTTGKSTKKKTTTRKS